MSDTCEYDKDGYCSNSKHVISPCYLRRATDLDAQNAALKVEADKLRALNKNYLDRLKTAKPMVVRSLKYDALVKAARKVTEHEAHEEHIEGYYWGGLTKELHKAIDELAYLVALNA